MRNVAPHAGAWIETGRHDRSRRADAVAPHAGAWIETRHNARRQDRRGVAPHAGAWIETSICRQAYCVSSRRPSRRGVDRNVINGDRSRRRCRRPSRRGVDRNLSAQLTERIKIVAPHAGAWIETSRLSFGSRRAGSRPSRRGVDRNVNGLPTVDYALGSPLTQGRGSKRHHSRSAFLRSMSPLTQGRGSKRARHVKPRSARWQVAPHAGAWIETPFIAGMQLFPNVAPHAGAWIETARQHQAA